MNTSLIATATGAGALALVSGYFLGKKYLPLGCVGCGRFGQAHYPKTEFVTLLRSMSVAIRQDRCGQARRFLLEATSKVKTKKEKASLLKAYRKLQRCQIRQINQE